MKKRIQQLATVTLTMIFCLLSFVFCIPSAHADEPVVNLALSPALQDIHIEKGENQKGSITVLNKGDKAVPLRVYAENFEASDMTGGISFSTEAQTEFSSMTWLKFKNPNIVLDPGKSEDLNFEIDCPKAAESGGHYSVVFFEPLNSQEVSDSSDLGISQRVGALLFITVGGDVRETGMVLGANTADKCSGVQCSFKTPAFREWGPVPFTFDFENTGNTHVRVTGDITIFNIFGQKVADIPINQTTVLPGMTRSFDAKWLRKPLFGRYTAKLTLNYGTNKTTAKAETSFWAIPWKLMIAIFAVLGIVYGLILLLRRKRKPLSNFIVQTRIKKSK